MICRKLRTIGTSFFLTVLSFRDFIFCVRFCYPREFHISSPSVSRCFPSFPSVTILTHPILLRRMHPLFCLNPCRCTASSFPVFEFEFLMLQWRYVVIMVLYTHELPFHMNRDHLRASIPACYVRDGTLAGTESRNEGRCSYRPNLWHSPVPGRSTKYTRKSKSVCPSSYHLWSLNSELLIKIVFKCLISTCACKTLRARCYVFQNNETNVTFEIVIYVRYIWFLDMETTVSLSNIRSYVWIICTQLNVISAYIVSHEHGTRKKLSVGKIK